MAMRVRQIEKLVEVVAQCDDRYHLTLMLLGEDKRYIQELKDYAEKIANGRVHLLRRLTHSGWSKPGAI